MKLLDIINEQITKPGSLIIPQPEAPKSDYLGAGGGFERTQYGGLSKEQYIKSINRLQPSQIKKVRLIFPQAKWEEIALQLLKKLGIITGIFDNLKSAINFIKNLAKKGVKTDEFVIGSHGSIGTLLTTKSGEENTFFNNEFLDQFKSIVHPGTKVFFTACYGANYLDSLKEAAERLGVGAYGSSGIYNYITNESEKGYYWCSSKPYQLPQGETIEPFEYRNNSIFVTISTKEEDDSEVNGIIKINNGVFDVNVKPINLIVTQERKTTSSYSLARNDFRLRELEIELRWQIYRAVSMLGKNPNSNAYDNNSWGRKEKQLNKSNQFMAQYIQDKFKNNEITVEIMFNGKMTNIKSLPKVIIPGDVTNEYLLEKGLCKKVPKSPINWI